MTERRTMQIFRAADAPLRSETEQLPPLPLTEEQTLGFERMKDAGFYEGGVLKLLFSAPGFSLVYVWFKPRYPLILHSHSSDCLYYVVAGEIWVGDNHLGPGDGVFVPADAPYTYRIGDEGVEVLEFRHSPLFTTKYSGATNAFFDRAVKVLQENREAWDALIPPRPARRRSDSKPS